MACAGGSTTGDEEESAEILGVETKRNTQHNESIPQQEPVFRFRYWSRDI